MHSSDTQYTFPQICWQVSATKASTGESGTQERCPYQGEKAEHYDDQRRKISS